MLADGLLVAAAAPLIISGRDFGLAMIPREYWTEPMFVSVSLTNDFRVAGMRNDGSRWSISVYDVRIDREIRVTPEASQPDPSRRVQMPSARPPLPEKMLAQWAQTFRAANPNTTEPQASQAIQATFPNHFVSRERLRRILPPRRRGRPLKDRD